MMMAMLMTTRMIMTMMMMMIMMTIAGDDGDCEDLPLMSSTSSLLIHFINFKTHSNYYNNY